MKSAQRRVTVNLIPRTSRALDEAIDLTGDNLSDTVNRAIRVYAWIEREIALGNVVLIGDQDGTFRGVELL